MQGRDRRLEIARGQTPFATLVSCSDSRVPPELLFGRGLGELFIVRNAGNTVDTAALGTIEYGVAALGVPLIVVMGHEKCGAVDAAVKVVTENATFPGSIGRMVEPIVPAVLDGAEGGRRPPPGRGAGERAPHRQPPAHRLRADAAGALARRQAPDRRRLLRHRRRLRGLLRRGLRSSPPL